MVHHSIMLVPISERGIYRFEFCFDVSSWLLNIKKSNAYGAVSVGLEHRYLDHSQVALVNNSPYL